MIEPKFSEDPRTVWLTEAGPDRGMRLIDAFWFDDMAGKRWSAPAGTRVDGASIPRPLWALVGSPYTGEYRRASIVHDVACIAAGGDPALRRAADKMFFRACRTGGCSRWDAMVLYVGVRIGAGLSFQELEDRRTVRIQRDAIDRRVEEDFRSACEFVLRQGETDDADALEERTDAALEAVALSRLALAEFHRRLVPR
jgi:hypothetical protein